MMKQKLTSLHRRTQTLMRTVALQMTFVTARGERGESGLYKPEEIHYMDVSTQQKLYLSAAAYNSIP